MVNHLKAKICKQQTPCVKQSFKGIKKQSRNSKRRVRRKRNKFRYYQTLRKQRTFKKTEELCEAVEYFDITEMEWSGASTVQLPLEIVEWQKRDQTAYWKSKALSLELENKMLRQHLRNIYAKTVQDYATYNQMGQEYIENEREENCEESNVKSSKKFSERRKSNKTELSELITPKFPDRVNRSEELKQIYGDKAPKILGMETAMQLNYERHLEKSKPAYWPNF